VKSNALDDALQHGARHYEVEAASQRRRIALLTHALIYVVGTTYLSSRNVEVVCEELIQGTQLADQYIHGQSASDNISGR
jgi:hypothetical protein